MKWMIEDVEGVSIVICPSAILKLGEIINGKRRRAKGPKYSSRRIKGM